MLEVDEMAQSQKDTTIATIVSLVAVALIFIYGYNETGRPLKATLVLLVGLAYTMGLYHAHRWPPQYFNHYVCAHPDRVGN